MSRKYKFIDDAYPHFVTFTVVHWVDIFTRDIYKDVFYNSIAYCQKNKGLKVYAYCIMTNHIHLIIGTTGSKMSDVVRDLKSFVSRHIRKEIENNSKESRRRWIMRLFTQSGLKNSNNKDFQFWIQNNHPIYLDSNELLDSRLEYIHNNPVSAGFVEAPEDWLHSSAGDYALVRKGRILLDEKFY